MRTITEHRAAALVLVGPSAEVEIALADLDGHVLARDVVAPTALPRWDNSAMDGYAVRVADLHAAREDHPVELTVLADLAAGSDAAPQVGPGTAARIMTGAPVPPGADAVVPVEHTDGGTSTVRVRRAPTPGAHVRRVGEDVAAGDLVLAAGCRMGPAQVAAAASVGCSTLTVHRRPRVAVLSTGSELVEPGTSLRRGQIPDSNSFLLAAAVRAAGCDVVRLGAVPDDAVILRRVLDELDGHPEHEGEPGLADGVGRVDAVVSSGGVSMGAYDVVKEVLTAEPAMEFVEVAMQPGKPQGLGRLRGGTPVFALPGNPVSAFVSFEVFVRPALLRLRGLGEVDRPMVEAVVQDGWRTPAGRAQYMPVVVLPPRPGAGGESGDLLVRRAARGGSGSHLVAGLAAAQGLALVEADVQEVQAGDRVRVMLVDR
ncbi:gephyrin-like molybdotransferase Glp [Actinotalea sp. K2]|uniref:molybdopterin molybdotransferase MoeA n=1 Tax=Actinotalea sp. K2 TaxID=2939438 RepID=UPI0020176818|nr:gephyrin-like molybdotransferase Glp [Actinotalea sp. K2]MCL3862778.1 molybdopterin molybdotransferase MoeA [Actinotalea sp. K2]